MPADGPAHSTSHRVFSSAGTLTVAMPSHGRTSRRCASKPSTRARCSQPTGGGRRTCRTRRDLIFLPDSDFKVASLSQMHLRSTVRLWQLYGISRTARRLRVRRPSVAFSFCRDPLADFSQIEAVSASRAKARRDRTTRSAPATSAVRWMPRAAARPSVAVPGPTALSAPTTSPARGQIISLACQAIAIRRPCRAPFDHSTRWRGFRLSSAR